MRKETRYCSNCGGGHHIFQCSKTVVKAQKKNDTHVTFDDESAFLSLNSNVQLSTFTQDLNKVYMQIEMSYVIDSNRVNGYHSPVAFPSTTIERCERTLFDNHDYSILRLPNRYIDTMVDDGYKPIYETFHFFDMTKSFEHISGSTNQSVDDVVEPTTLGAQVSYGDNESEINNWIIDSGSTHHMNGHSTEFFM